MVLSEAIQECSDYARHELRRSDKTWRAYAANQRHFARWLASQGHADPEVREISTSLIRRYSYSLSARDLRPRSIRGSLCAVRALFSFLAQMKLVDENPALEVRLPKKDAAQWLVRRVSTVINSCPTSDRTVPLSVSGRSGRPASCRRF